MLSSQKQNRIHTRRRYAVVVIFILQSKPTPSYRFAEIEKDAPLRHEIPYEPSQLDPENDVFQCQDTI